MQIDKESLTPIYVQVEEIIKENIKNKIWKAGVKIPSEKELTETLSVSRGTLKKAIANLVDAGYLIQKQGLGTFVVKDELEFPLAEGLYSFSEYLKSKGIDYENILISSSIKYATTKIAKSLNINEGDPYFCLERLRKVEGEIIMFIQNNINMKLVPGIETADFSNNSLFAIIESLTDLKISYSQTHFAAISADVTKAKQLDIDVNSPILYQEQIVHLQNTEVIEFARVWLKSNRFTLGTVLHRNN